MTTRFAAGVALALMGLPVMAAEPNQGFYAGFGLGEVTLEDDIAGAKFKGTEAAFKLFGGYRFNEYGSLEVAYLDANEIIDTQVGITVFSDASAFQGSAIWQVPMGASFEGFVRGSLFAWEADNMATALGMDFTEQNEGTDWGFGIGAAYHVTPSIGLRAEFEMVEFDGTDAEAWSLSGIYRF